MRQEDHDRLEPGMRVLISSELQGAVYGGEDPESLKVWCGKEATVARVEYLGCWMVYIQEDEDDPFYMEEIECIIDDVEIEESEEPIGLLIGGAM